MSRNSDVVDGDAAAPLARGSYAGGVRFEVLGRLRVIDGLRPWGPTRVLGCASAAPVSSSCSRCCSPHRTRSSRPTPSSTGCGATPRHAPPGTPCRATSSELRKLLGAVIERDGGGYVVRVDDSSLDSLEFESLVSRGRAELVDAPEAAVALLRAALGLWRGAPFTGLDDASVLLVERARLEQLQLSALEDCGGAELALGRHREIVSELDALSREHPFREGLQAQHMLALYRSGRQAEALRAFQRTRARWSRSSGSSRRPCYVSWRSRSWCRIRRSTCRRRLTRDRPIRAGR